MQRQMNRARGARVIRRSKGTEHCDYVVTRPHQHLGRQEAAAYATRGGRGVRYADCQRASRKLSVHAVVLCAPCSHYTAQALRARGKRAVVLPHAFGLPAIVVG